MRSWRCLAPAGLDELDRNPLDRLRHSRCSTEYKTNLACLCDFSPLLAFLTHRAAPSALDG